MNNTLRHQIARLSLEERLELVETIWSDVELAGLEPELTPAQEAILDERYRQLLDNPDAPRKTLKEIAAKLGVSL